MPTISTYQGAHTEERPAVASSHFRKLANLITIADICSPFIATIDGERSVGEVGIEWCADWCFETGLDPMAQIALVRSEGRIQGWIGYDMLEADKTLSECMEPITPDTILTADTSLIEATAAFSPDSPHFFLVLKGNQFVGWLSYDDLHKPPLRLCLFAMLINIERLLLDATLLSPKQSLDLLSAGRLDKAKTIYALRGYGYDREGHPYSARLLECTTIADKIATVRKLPNIRQAVRSLGDGKFRRDVERLRNEIAHPGSRESRPVLLPRDRLWPFIELAERLQSELEGLLEQGKSV